MELEELEKIVSLGEIALNANRSARIVNFCEDLATRKRARVEARVEARVSRNQSRLPFEK